MGGNEMIRIASAEQQDEEAEAERISAPRSHLRGAAMKQASRADTIVNNSPPFTTPIDSFKQWLAERVVASKEAAKSAAAVAKAKAPVYLEKFGETCYNICRFVGEKTQKVGSAVVRETKDKGEKCVKGWCIIGRKLQAWFRERLNSIPVQVSFVNRPAPEED